MKLIGIDLDGTLLNHEKKISKENINAIRDAQSEGIEVSIVTGRPFFNVKSILEDADLTTYVISNNGSSIHSREGNQLYSVTMDKKDIIEITSFLEDRNFYYEVSTDDIIYTPSNVKEIFDIEIDKLKSANPDTDMNSVEAKNFLKWIFNESMFKRIDSFNDFKQMNDKFCNVLAFSFDNNKKNDAINHFKTMDHLDLFSSSDHNFELINRLTSKGIALEKLSSMINSSMDECMAIGDSYNDVSMLRMAKHSVAMGNANADIRELCSFTTLKNDEHGVAHAIYKFINGTI